MRQNRFYLKDKLIDQSIVLTDRLIVNQLKNVLRIKVGDIIFLFNGQGTEVKTKIQKINQDNLELLVVERIKKDPVKPTVNLYLAILKKENFELAVQKATEVGVQKIIPIITDRTVKLGLKKDRLQLIIKEASEQSGQFYLPELSAPLDFRGVLDQTKNSLATNVFCDLEDEDSEILANEEINLFIGPEGGWSESEQQLAKQAGFFSRQLGRPTLRAETAAIVASWLAVNKKL